MASNNKAATLTAVLSQGVNKFDKSGMLYPINQKAQQIKLSYNNKVKESSMKVVYEDISSATHSQPQGHPKQLVLKDGHTYCRVGHSYADCTAAQRLVAAVKVVGLIAVAIIFAGLPLISSNYCEHITTAFREAYKGQQTVLHYERLTAVSTATRCPPSRMNHSSRKPQAQLEELLAQSQARTAAFIQRTNQCQAERKAQIEQEMRQRLEQQLAEVEVLQANVDSLPEDFPNPLLRQAAVDQMRQTVLACFKSKCEIAKSCGYNISTL
jgi:hypothetical protein